MNSAERVAHVESRIGVLTEAVRAYGPATPVTRDTWIMKCDAMAAVRHADDCAELDACYRELKLLSGSV